MKPMFPIRLLAAALAAVHLVGCGTVLNFEDPTFIEKLPYARTTCKGSEIVGIWVSKQPVWGGSYSTILFKPDGTGLMSSQHIGMDFGGGSDWNLRWRYSGAGVWEVDQTPAGGLNQSASAMFNWQMKAKVRFTGTEVLYQWDSYSKTGFSGTMRTVFVPGEDDATVDKYLKERR